MGRPFVHSRCGERHTVIAGNAPLAGSHGAARRARVLIALRSEFIRRSGGIGRRARLRIWCPQGCGGSSPPSDTKCRLMRPSGAASAFHLRNRAQIGRLCGSKTADLGSWGQCVGHSYIGRPPGAAPCTNSDPASRRPVAISSSQVLAARLRRCVGRATLAGCDGGVAQRLLD